MRRLARGFVIVTLLASAAVLVGGASGPTPTASPFVVDDLELISQRSRSDWSGDWSGPIQAAAVLAWFHDHGYPALLEDLNGDGVVDELDTIELADRFGKGSMKTGESLDLTHDAWLVYGLASYVAAAYPNTFELKIYDSGFPEEYAVVGTFAEGAVPGIVMTLKPAATVAAYQTELVGEEGVIVGIPMGPARNTFLAGRSFETTSGQDIPVDFAWSEEDRMKPGLQGQVLNTVAHEAEPFSIYFQDDWKPVEFMIALSPTKPATGTPVSGCSPDAIAYDLTTTTTEFGTVQIEECVTRSNGVDTYAYTITNRSLTKLGCGVLGFSVQNSYSYATLDQGGPAGWRSSAPGDPAWSWDAPSGSPGIIAGESARFWFSIPAPSRDCVALQALLFIPGSEAGVKTTVKAETTAPCAPETAGAVEGPATCPDLTVEIDRADCNVEAETECDCILNITATVTNIGTAAAGSFKVKLSSAAGDDEATVLSLAAGASKSVRFRATFPCPDVLPPWHSTVEVRVDSRNTVTECKEDNNTADRSVRCSP